MNKQKAMLLAGKRGMHICQVIFSALLSKVNLLITLLRSISVKLKIKLEEILQ